MCYSFESKVKCILIKRESEREEQIAEKLQYKYFYLKIKSAHMKFPIQLHLFIRIKAYWIYFKLSKTTKYMEWTVNWNWLNI